MAGYNTATVNGVTHQTVLSEAQIKKVLEKYNPDSYRFTDRLFGDSDRITIPVDNITLHDNEPFLKNEDYLKVKSFLYDKKYEILDYAQGICKYWFKYNIIKIGKVLERLKAPEDVIVAFTNGPSRQAARKRVENLRITISRNPFDVASMSTNRGWTSCMNLNGGCHRGKVMFDIKHGTHIAYLHEKDDVDILKPMARVLLKAHRKKYSRINTLNKVLVPEPNSYGMGVGNFVSTVENWCKKSFFPEIDTIYTKSGQLYDDGSGSEFVKFAENSKFLYSDVVSERIFIATKGTDNHRIHLSADNNFHVIQTAVINLKNKKLITHFIKNDPNGKMVSSYMHFLDVDIAEHRNYIFNCDFTNMNGYTIGILMRDVLRSPEHLAFFKDKLFAELDTIKLLGITQPENNLDIENDFINEIFERNKNNIAIKEYFAWRKEYFAALNVENKKIVLKNIKNNLLNAEGSQRYVSYIEVLTNDGMDVDYTVDDIPDNVDGEDDINILKDFCRLKLTGEKIISHKKFDIVNDGLDVFGNSYRTYIGHMIIHHYQMEISSILRCCIEQQEWVKYSSAFSIEDFSIEKS